ncbi:MAG: hypothetical protein ACRCYX_06035 [Dermatophilaceae bacterium]
MKQTRHCWLMRVLYCPERLDCESLCLTDIPDVAGRVADGHLG